MPASRSEGASFFSAARALLEDLPGLISDRVQLLTLELRRSGQALGQIIVLGIAAAVLLLTAWVALWVGVVALIALTGVHWAWGVLIVLIVNAAAAAFAAMRAMSLTHLLALPATFRHLTVASAYEAPSRPDDHITTAPATARSVDTAAFGR